MSSGKKSVVPKAESQERAVNLLAAAMQDFGDRKAHGKITLCFQDGKLHRIEKNESLMVDAIDKSRKL